MAGKVGGCCVYLGFLGKHMETRYKYISSIEYINSLTFKYVETYSFQRGTDYEENLRLAKPDYDRLKVKKEKRNNLTPDEELRLSELHTLLGFTQYLINDKGQFHPSSKKINTFQQGEPIVERLISILKTEITDIPMSMCAPTYRDAIVFYDGSGVVISVLNVCLSCQYMETKMFNHINGDYETYYLLKKFFIDIGHHVEEPTKFVWDDLKELKAKYDKQKRNANAGR
jgi:hypothetical protein